MLIHLAGIVTCLQMTGLVLLASASTPRSTESFPLSNLPCVIIRPQSSCLHYIRIHRYTLCFSLYSDLLYTPHARRHPLSWPYPHRGLELNRDDLFLFFLFRPSSGSHWRQQQFSPFRSFIYKIWVLSVSGVSVSGLMVSSRGAGLKIYASN